MNSTTAGPSLGLPLLWFLAVFGVASVVVAAIGFAGFGSPKGASLLTAGFAAGLSGQWFGQRFGATPSGNLKWRLIWWSTLICLIFNVASFALVLISLGGFEELGKLAGVEKPPENFWQLMVFSIFVISALQFFAVWAGYGPIARFFLKTQRRK